MSGQLSEGAFEFAVRVLAAHRGQTVQEFLIEYLAEFGVVVVSRDLAAKIDDSMGASRPVRRCRSAKSPTYSMSLNTFPVGRSDNQGC